jgi:hypothetical protein
MQRTPFLPVSGVRIEAFDIDRHHGRLQLNGVDVNRMAAGAMISLKRG